MTTGLQDRPSTPSGSPPVFNVPNQLTSLRLILAIVMFVFITYELYLVSFVLFAIAAGTDWLDGYWARKYGQITTLGRILDPFADKVIICGTFIFLAAIPGSHLVPWMAVVVMGRELLVTALRSYLEQQGADFSATMSGKLKMVLQCFAAGGSLLGLYLSKLGDLPAWYSPTLTAIVWAAIVLTVVSGVVYVLAAVRLLRAGRAG